MRSGELRSGLQTLAKFALVSVILAGVATAVTGYGAAARDSTAVRNDLAREVVESAAEIDLSLSILVGGLTPGAQLGIRCRGEAGDLPVELDVARDQVCADAALREIVEEQELAIELRRSLEAAKLLVIRLDDQLESDRPARHWAAIVDGFDGLRLLETSTVCNEARLEVVDDRLRSPSGDPVVDRNPWLDDELVAQLVGPRSSPVARCDQHGEAFPAAHRRVRAELVAESLIVADEIRAGHVTNLADRPGDVLGSLLDWQYLGALIVAVALWAVASRLPSAPTKPLEVRVLPDGDPPDPDGLRPDRRRVR